ncbi:MAG: hypothetical protein Q3X17_01455, partial [Ruminococcus sp.]|nr:hypothetical protein [Ruminococcus sp.]
YGLAYFRSDNKVKRKKNFLPEVKSLVNLFKGCGCGQRPQIFFFYTMSDSQMACRLAIKICNRLKFYGRCPHPQPLKRLDLNFLII